MYFACHYFQLSICNALFRWNCAKNVCRGNLRNFATFPQVFSREAFFHVFIDRWTRFVMTCNSGIMPWLVFLPCGRPCRSSSRHDVIDQALIHCNHISYCVGPASVTFQIIAREDLWTRCCGNWWPAGPFTTRYAVHWWLTCTQRGAKVAFGGCVFIFNIRELLGCSNISLRYFFLVTSYRIESCMRGDKRNFSSTTVYCSGRGTGEAAI